MRLELRVAGPGLEVVRPLRVGEAPLVVGRDAECEICLPDPQKTVSRRHLLLWMENGDLHFKVLSIVNGVEMPFGEAPPGARGVLPAGSVMKVGEYAISATVHAEPADSAPAGGAADKADPWAVFDRDASGIAPAVQVATSTAAAEDDPFSDWGFESTFGPQQAGMDAASLGAGDATAFFKGLGLRGGPQGPMTQGELETIGRLVRMLAESVLDLDAEVQAVKQQLNAEDRTMVAPRGPRNPLRSDWNTEAKLRFLFGGIAAAAGPVGPERALRELLLELAAHNDAGSASVKHVVRSTIEDFEPEALKSRLLGGGGRLFESARAWDAFTKYYEAESADLDKWTQRQLDRHFAEAYLREIHRNKRDRGQGGS